MEGSVVKGVEVEWSALRFLERAAVVWGVLWRSVVAVLLAGLIAKGLGSLFELLAVPLGLVSRSGVGRSLWIGWAGAAILTLIVFALCQFVLLRWLLRARYGALRLALVRDAAAAVVTSAPGGTSAGTPPR